MSPVHVFPEATLISRNTSDMPHIAVAGNKEARCASVPIIHRESSSNTVHAVT